MARHLNRPDGGDPAGPRAGPGPATRRRGRCSRRCRSARPSGMIMWLRKMPSKRRADPEEGRARLLVERVGLELDPVGAERPRRHAPSMEELRLAVRGPSAGTPARPRSSRSRAEGAPGRSSCSACCRRCRSVDRSIVTNGSSVRAATAASAASTMARIPSGVEPSAGIQRPDRGIVAGGRQPIEVPHGDRLEPDERTREDRRREPVDGRVGHPPSLSAGDPSAVADGARSGSARPTTEAIS